MENFQTIVTIILMFASIGVYFYCINMVKEDPAK